MTVIFKNRKILSLALEWPVFLRTAKSWRSIDITNMNTTPNSSDDWEKEFENELTSKKCSLLKLMYDKNNIEQKECLRALASGNKHDPKLWLQYIECTVNSKANKEKQLQLLRMVNTCLSMLAPVENQLSEDSSFINIHLQVIALKRR